MTTALGSVHFLLVDDLEENLLALEALLRRDGLVLLKARSGPEALELLLKHDVALALVDVQMAGMDGFELAELMRGAERTRRVPIIFLTAGSADRQRRFRGYEAGAVDFLHKPIEPDILRSKADVFFELYRQRQEVSQQRDEIRTATQEIARLLKESQEQARALQEADRRKDEFLAMLAHELRNPLAPVSNAIQIMKMSAQPSPEIADLRDLMERQISHLTRLVDDLMEVSRISRGIIELRRERVGLSTIIQAAIEISRPLIDEAGHRLTVGLPDDKLVLNADHVRLSQVVANLLTNAAKYMEPNGSIDLTVSQDNSDAVISVRDNGLGIPPEMLPRIFEMFAQMEHTRRLAQGGLGIGLALAKRLVEMHGGQLVARSEGVGKGSEFVVRLPLSIEPTAPRNDAPRASGPADVPKRKILVVDDTRAALLVLSKLLTVMGQDVCAAHNGAEALDSAQRERPDIIISDIGMPDIDGYELARRIRQMPALKNVILVALTGYGQLSDQERTRECGFDLHLVKPVGVNDLRRLLTTLPERAEQ